MALQVGFLKGTQASLNTLLNDIKAGTKTAQAGAFYITEDSNRIYFAQSETNLQYLNKYITTVAKVSDLPTDSADVSVGDFYYIVDGNILCRYDGDTTESGVSGKPQWTQVNPDTQDTDTTDRIKSLEISDGAINDAGNAIEFTLTATEQSYDVKVSEYTGNARNIVTDATFALNKSILDKWYNLANVDLNATVDTTNKKATVKLSGVGAVSEAQVTIASGTNVTIEQDGTDGIKISATDTNTTYEMVSPANEAKIHLDSSVGTNDAGTVEFVAGTDLKVDGTTEGQITYSHKTGYLTSASNQVTDAQTPHQNETFDIITGVHTSNGHVTQVNTSTVTLPYISDIKNYTSTTTSENPTGKISIVVKDGAGDPTTITSSEQFGLKVNDTLVPLGGDLAEYFYTEDEIDDKFTEYLKSVNAMVFKGALPITDPEAFPTNPSIGDTYIVNADTKLAIDGKTLEIGDLVIASGEENDNGVIANPTWILVESNEIDTTYTMAAAGDYITLTPSTTSGDDTKTQKIQLTDDGVVTLGTDSGAIKAEHSKTTPDDNAPTSTTALSYDGEIVIVTNVDANDYGHVTKIESAKIKLPGAHKLAHNETDGSTELQDNAADVVGSIDVDGTGVITVTSADNGQGSNYTVEHNKLTETQQAVPTAPADSNATLLSHEGYFTAVTEATRDVYGHVTGYTLSKYKLPADNNTTYTLSGATAETITENESIQLTSTLTDSAGDSSTAKFRINSLNDNVIVATENIEITDGETSRSIPIVKIDLTWGTF